METETWRIGEITVMIRDTMREKLEDDEYNVHYNTVDRWFKDLENEMIHYVERSGGKKVYDKSDYQIGCFIAEHASMKKASLSVIYKQVPLQLKVRPFPEDFTSEASPMIGEGDIVNLIEKVLAENYNIQKGMDLAEIISKKINQLALPEPVDPVAEREYMLLKSKEHHEAGRLLEERAAEAWETFKKENPQEATIQVGGFFNKKSIEDPTKRAAFINEFKKKHLDEIVEEAYK